MNNSIKQNKLHFKKKNNIYSFNYTSVKGRTLLSMLTENHSLSDYDILHKPIKYNFLLTDKPKIIKSVRLLKNKLIINKRKILKKNIIKKNKKKIKRYKKLLKKKIKRYKKLFKKKIKKLKNVNKNSLFFRLCKKINYVKTFKFFKRFFKRVSFLKSKNLFNNKGHIKRGIITIKKKRKILIKKDDNRNHKCFYHSKYDL